MKPNDTMTDVQFIQELQLALGNIREGAPDSAGALILMIEQVKVLTREVMAHREAEFPFAYVATRALLVAALAARLATEGDSAEYNFEPPRPRRIEPAVLKLLAAALSGEALTSNNTQRIDGDGSEERTAA
jgi:hypothetical protein